MNERDARDNVRPIGNVDKLPPADVAALMPDPSVPLCGACVVAYRNGIEPGETACETRARTDPPHSAAGGSIGVDAEARLRPISGLADAPEMPVSLGVLEEPMRRGGIELADLGDHEAAALAAWLRASVFAAAHEFARRLKKTRDRPASRL